MKCDAFLERSWCDPLKIIKDHHQKIYPMGLLSTLLSCNFIKWDWDRAQPDWTYEFPDRTGLDTQICRTGPSGPDWIRTYIFKHFTCQVGIINFPWTQIWFKRGSKRIDKKKKISPPKFLTFRHPWDDMTKNFLCLSRMGDQKESWEWGSSWFKSQTISLSKILSSTYNSYIAQHIIFTST